MAFNISILLILKFTRAKFIQCKWYAIVRKDPGTNAMLCSGSRHYGSWSAITSSHYIARQKFPNVWTEIGEIVSTQWPASGTNWIDAQKHIYNGKTIENVYLDLLCFLILCSDNAVRQFVLSATQRILIISDFVEINCVPECTLNILYSFNSGKS